MKLMVLDGNSIVNRAFYGIRQLTTRSGAPTNGIYGFLTILNKLTTDEEPDALCVTFDVHAPTFRHEKYAEYKAQRKAMPEELAAQMPVLKDVLDAMNIPRYEMAGWEADDLIGTISEKCAGAGWECVIVTGDKDSFQLINATTRVKHVKTRMGQTETRDYTEEVFTAEYGFEPPKIVDLKALMGDPSDNIPGVAGIGEKTALDLVRRFGGIAAIYASLDALDIRDTVKDKLRIGRESAEMSYDLAKIRTDAPLDFSPEDNLRRDVSGDKLYALFRELEFTKLTEKFGLKAPEGDTAPPPSAGGEAVEIVRRADAREMVAALGKSGGVAAVRILGDFEAVAVAGGDAAYVLRRGATEEYDAALLDFFSADIKKARHDIKDTIRQLRARKIPAEGWVFDTALAAYLLSPTDASYELARLARRELGVELDAADEPDGQMSLLADEGVETRRLASEARAISQLYTCLDGKLRELHMDRLYYEIEMPLCSVLADMELTGFLVDRDALRAFGAMLSEKISELESGIYAEAGEAFNINSPKQLGAVLFDKLQLPAPKKTKTGWSTNADVLESLRGKHPIIDMILEYRQYTKLKSTYADGLLKVIAPDGRIHTSFQMTVTATGRLSSTEPNLQNIPVRRELGGEIRKMFVAGPGNVLVDADYSQIELRLLAHISDDKMLQAAFQSGEDIHAVTASQVFSTPLDEVTPLQRSRAKAVNFGIVYGISAFSLSQDIGVGQREAKAYIDSYLEKYSGVRAYMTDIIQKAKRDGFVETLYGRRRYLPELKSGNHNERAFGERVALNMPIQGTAADIMKLAMDNVARRIQEDGLSAKLVLQVHDELIIECPEGEADAAARVLREEMEGAAHLAVPLTVDTHTGKSWFEAK